MNEQMAYKYKTGGENESDEVGVTDSDAKWYRVAGCGCSGEAQKTAEMAWASFYRETRRLYGYGEDNPGLCRDAHDPALYGATTKDAADDACVSKLSGKCGNAEWWRIGP